ncbi:MAG: dihydropteroate synthase, partial [Vulcanimicrobiaceae bacterium]
DALLDVVRGMHAGIVIMHNRERPVEGSNVLEEVLAFLGEASDRALRCGIPSHNIILDPGIGFGKTPEQNVAILANLPKVVELGFPTLLGTSRKSTLGLLTGRRDPVDRVAATTATTAFAVMARMDVVRVHDVAAACDAVAVSDAIVRGWRPLSWTVSQ